MPEHKQATWWGTYHFELDQTALWEIGPLRLAVQRLVNEWQVAYETGESSDPETDVWSQDLNAADLNDLNFANSERYVTGQSGASLRLQPALADRPLITRPITPFYVPAGETTAVFLSSPLWVRLEVGDPPTPLREMPILRPSDTWFGSSTMEGELCYASRTFARLNLENIPLRPHRALTQVLIDNRAESQLAVERINLPVPYLSLFETVDGLLWTQKVTMIRTRDTAMAAFQVDKRPPEEVKSPLLIGEPRQPLEQNTIIRAFEVLFR